MEWMGTVPDKTSEEMKSEIKDKSTKNIDSPTQKSAANLSSGFENDPSASLKNIDFAFGMNKNC